MLHDITVARSVAVLPFENMSADPENEYFSDGVTDDIISTLSKIAALKVVCRTSTMQYKKTGKRIAAIAEELGVATILEGSVRRAGPRVRIVARLVDPRTAKQLWGETYDRQLLDVFEVQSELAQQIAGALATALSPEEKQRLEKKPTDQAEAYNLYLLGRYHANKWSEAEVQKAIGHFEGAIAKDPGYALAYAGLADAYELLSIGLSSKPATECLAQAKAMALKALELDDTLAEAHTSLAYARWLGDLDWRGAVGRADACGLMSGGRGPGRGRGGLAEGRAGALRAVEREDTRAGAHTLLADAGWRGDWEGGGGGGEFRRNGRSRRLNSFH